jgi:hypothetical protein
MQQRHAEHSIRDFAKQHRHWEMGTALSAGDVVREYRSEAATLLNREHRG